MDEWRLSLMENIENQKGMAVLSHVLGLITGFLGPLILYLVLEDSKSFAKEHAREALNFQITLIIGFIVSGILALILIGILFMVVLGLLDLIFCILAAVAANNEQEYRYPFSIRFIK
jgi:uncharacterized protein